MPRTQLKIGKEEQSESKSRVWRREGVMFSNIVEKYIRTEWFQWSGVGRIQIMRAAK